MDEQRQAIEYFDKALFYADKILPLLPDFSHFNISAIVLDSNWSDQDKNQANDISHFIESLLVDKLKYAQEQNGRFWLELNDTGRLAKKPGGHFAYLKQLADKATIDNERQKLNDEKLKYDIKNAKRIFKTYWWTFYISIAAFLLAVGKIIYDILTKTK